MKYYKLKNDIPMFKKGDLFFIHPEEGCLLQKDTLRLAYHKETLEKNPEILKDWFEEVEESENKRWKTKEYGKYWYVSEHGNADMGLNPMCESADYRYATGNYFKSMKEAEDYKKYLIARQVLLDDAEGGKFVPGSSNNWYNSYCLCLELWSTFSTGYYYPGAIYFKSEEALLKSLKEHEEQWEIVRKYEMGEM